MRGFNHELSLFALGHDVSYAASTLLDEDWMESYQRSKRIQSEFDREQEWMQREIRSTAVPTSCTDIVAAGRAATGCCRLVHDAMASADGPSAFVMLYRS